MNPKPFLESNHLTFPVGMAVLPQIGAACRVDAPVPQASVVARWRR